MEHLLVDEVHFEYGDFPPLNSLSAAALQQDRFHYTGSSRGRLPLPSPDVRKMVDEATCWCFSCWDGHPDAASDALVGMWIYHDISWYIQQQLWLQEIWVLSSEMTPDPKHEQKRIGRIATQSGDVTFSPTPQSLWCLALPGVLIQCTKNLGCANKASPRLDFKGWSVVQFDISIVWLYICIYIYIYIYIYTLCIYIHMSLYVCVCKVYFEGQGKSWILNFEAFWGTFAYICMWWRQEPKCQYVPILWE